MPNELIPKFMSPNKVISIVILVVVILLGMNAFETVEKGTYSDPAVSHNGNLNGQNGPWNVVSMFWRCADLASINNL